MPGCAEVTKLTRHGLREQLARNPIASVLNLDCRNKHQRDFNHRHSKLRWGNQVTIGATAISGVSSIEGEAPAGPIATSGQQSPEAPRAASGGRRAKARLQLSRSFALE